MGRLIDADKLIEELDGLCPDHKPKSIGYIVKATINDCVKIVKKQPAVDNKDTNVGKWIPADNPPKPEEYIVLSFDNFSVPLFGMYREDDGGGSYYVGDDDESCSSQGLLVNAWMPLPEPYRKE